MEVLEKVTVTEERTVRRDVLCNKCGQSLRKSMGEFEGLVECYIMGGYASKLGDMVAYRFSLCEDCLQDLFKNFLYDPVVLDDEDPEDVGREGRES